MDNGHDSADSIRADRNETLLVFAVGVFACQRQRVGERKLRTSNRTPCFKVFARAFCGSQLAPMLDYAYVHMHGVKPG